MKTNVINSQISGRFNLNRTMNNIASELGAKLLLKSLRDEVSQELSPFGITSVGFLEPEEQEIMVCADHRAAVSSHLVHVGDRRFLETIILFTDDEINDTLLRLYKEIPQVQGNLTRGSVRDAARTRRLERALSKLSPSGQKLANPNFQKVLHKCLNSDTRKILGEIYNTYETALVPYAILKQSEVSSAKGKTLDKILNDTDLFKRKYIISCPKCCRYVAPLIYDSKEPAQSAVNGSEGSQCPACSEPLSVNEGFSVTEIGGQCAVHGMWLEFLVYNTVKKRAVAAFAGRMAGLHELDVVAVLGEETILFECKDTSFGHNDAFIMAGKAQAIGASRVYAISTQAIHSNVRQAIDEQSKSRRRIFHLEEAGDTNLIRSKVETFLSDIEQNYVQRMFLPSRHTPYGERGYRFYQYGMYDENFD